MSKALSDETIARIVMYRALNYNQRDIADELGIGTRAVSQYLKQVEREAQENGVEETFQKYVRELYDVNMELKSVEA